MLRSVPAAEMQYIYDEPTMPVDPVVSLPQLEGGKIGESFDGCFVGEPNTTKRRLETSARGGTWAFLGYRLNIGLPTGGESLEQFTRTGAPFSGRFWRYIRVNGLGARSGKDDDRPRSKCVTSVRNSQAL